MVYNLRARQNAVFFPRMGLEMNKKLVLFGIMIGAGFAMSGIGAKNAHAECYYVPSPCEAARAAPQNSNWHHHNQNRQNNYVIIEENNDGNAYAEGYADGVRAGRANAHRTGHHVAKKAKTKVRANNHRTRTSHAASRSRSAHATNVRQHRTSHNISSNSYVRNPTPIKDYARTYNASAVGRSVPVAAYAGRGESWVQSSGYIVRYSTPANVSVINGQSCGYGYGYGHGGQIINRRAWVCHCAQGWMPPR